MEEILNNLIYIDNECKKMLNELKEKQDNIEYLVNEELTKRKDEIKTKYKFKIDMKINEYDMKFEEYQEKIENQTDRQIEEIKNKYIAEKSNIIREVIEAIM